MPSYDPDSLASRRTDPLVRLLWWWRSCRLHGARASGWAAPFPNNFFRWAVSRSSFSRCGRCKPLPWSTRSFLPFRLQTSNTVSARSSRGNAFTKVTKVVAGGAERQDSVRHALAQIPSDTEIVLIHDAVRPFVTLRMIAEVVAAARKEERQLLRFRCGIP
mgnify:CR=1 FL=1